MPSGTDYGLEESASSLSSSDEEVDLPKGVFIVEKIRAHRRYGELLRRKLLEERDGYGENYLFFLVKWKGYPGEDTWEPLETVQKIEPFKDYVKKHKDVIQLNMDSDSQDTDDTTGQKKREDLNHREKANRENRRHNSEKGARKEKISSKESALSANSSHHSHPPSPSRHKRIHSDDSDDDQLSLQEHLKRFKKSEEIVPAISVEDSESPYSERRHNFDSNEMDSHETSQRKSKTSHAAKGIRKKKRKARDFRICLKRTRSQSPLKCIRPKDFWHPNGKSLDDLYYITYTKSSSLLSVNEQKHIHQRYIRMARLLRHLRDALPREVAKMQLAYREAKLSDYDKLDLDCLKTCKELKRATTVIWSNLLKIIKTEEEPYKEFSLQGLEGAIEKLSEEFEQDTVDELILKACLHAYENTTLLLWMTCSPCCPTVHNICRTLRLLLSSLSHEGRCDLFDKMNRKAENRFLERVVQNASRSNSYCVLDTVVDLGATVSHAKTNALWYSIASGDRNMVLHLIRKGFALDRTDLPQLVDALGDYKSSKYNMTELLDVFLARLELEAKRNSSEVLDAMEIDDAQPISNVYVHRLGQLDRRLLIIHGAEIHTTENDGELSIQARQLPVVFRNTLKFRLGVQYEKMKLSLYSRDSVSSVYFFPQDHCYDLGFRVHLSLDYKQMNSGEIGDSLIMVQLWSASVPELL